MESFLSQKIETSASVTLIASAHQVSTTMASSKNYSLALESKLVKSLVFSPSSLLIRLYAETLTQLSSSSTSVSKMKSNVSRSREMEV